MKEIKKNGPVQMVFKVFNDFFMYKSGIYSRHNRSQTLSNEISYHSVNVFGWNYTTNGIAYWVKLN